MGRECTHSVHSDTHCTVRNTAQRFAGLALRTRVQYRKNLCLRGRNILLTNTL